MFHRSRRRLSRSQRRLSPPGLRRLAALEEITGQPLLGPRTHQRLKQRPGPGAVFLKKGRGHHHRLLIAAGVFVRDGRALQVEPHRPLPVALVLENEAAQVTIPGIPKPVQARAP